jgi:hypothetical protein
LDSLGPMFSLAELKSASVACGLASTAPRAAQLEALKSFYLRDAQHFPLPPGPVLSLDLGLRNLGACVIQDRTVLSWEKYDLDVPAVYCPRAYAQHISDFCTGKLLTGFEGNLIFIERQRHRSGSMSSIFETIVRLAILEAQLHALLKDRFVCIPVNPGAVARFHGLPVGKEKKAAAVNKVRTMQADWVQIPDNLFKRFLGQAKKDDLADSLLQAVAGISFRRNCREFFEVKHPELLPNKQIILNCGQCCHDNPLIIPCASIPSIPDASKCLKGSKIK